MKLKNIFSLKNIALGLSTAAVVGGVAATIAQTAVSANAKNPFVLIFTNGGNKEANSDYRLLGRHQQGYKNPDLSDKIGQPNFNSWETELGLELDNSNPTVVAEQLNWMYYLLFYKQLRGDGSYDASESKDDYAKHVNDSTFDGIRIDCGDAVDSDVIDQTGQLLDKLYGRENSDADANDHLSYNEGYGPYDAAFEKEYFHNSSLDYDDSYYQNMRDYLMWYKKDKAPNLKYATSYIAKNWNDDQTVNEIDPNLTYSQNHDNFNEKIWDLALLDDPNFTYKNYNKKKAKEIETAAEKYYANLGETNKIYKGHQISPMNQISLYADMLINKDTVPIVFYGDIFESEKGYMEKPSIIAEPIMDILSLRSKYVAGGQQRQLHGNNIISNVRFGKDYYEKDGKTIDPRTGNENDLDIKNPTSGIVTVFSNDSSVDKKITVYVGKAHAGQNYVNVIDTSDASEYGLTVNNSLFNFNNVMGAESEHNSKLDSPDSKPVKVAPDGTINVEVKGTEKAFVNGYLGMWVPDGAPADQNVYVSQDAARNMKSFKGEGTKKGTGKILNSNEALDSHVLFQDFSTIMPNQGLDEKEQDKDQYALLTKNAQKIADSGITDIWMAPPYVSPDQNKEGSLLDWVARYGYGYMMSDRYNLGETDNKEKPKTPSKYGTAQQLIDATDALHQTKSKIAGRSIKNMVDFVPHQIIRGEEKEYVTFDEYFADKFGSPLRLGAAQVSKYLETKTSDDNLQHTYGGKYLDIIKSFFEGGKMHSQCLDKDFAIDPSDKITNWQAKYEDAFPLEFGSDSYSDSSNQDNKFDGYYVSKRD